MKKPGKEKVGLEETFFCWINHKCTLPFHHAHELKYLKTRLFLPPTPAWNTGELFPASGKTGPRLFNELRTQAPHGYCWEPPDPYTTDLECLETILIVHNHLHHLCWLLCFCFCFHFFETESHWVDWAVTKQLRSSPALPPKCWESRFLPQNPALGFHFLSLGLECLFLPLFFPSQMFFSSHAMQRDVLRENVYTTSLFPSLNKEMKS